MGLTAKIQPLPTPIIKEDDLYIIFSKKTISPEFVERFSTVLRAFKKTDSYRVIYEKYLASIPIAELAGTFARDLTRHSASYPIAQFRREMIILFVVTHRAMGRNVIMGSPTR